MRLAASLVCCISLAGSLYTGPSAAASLGWMSRTSLTQRATGGAQPYAESPRSFGLLYTFEGAPDGAVPNFLINVNGTIYGTTAYGGLSNDYATRFRTPPSGEEQVCY